MRSLSQLLKELSRDIKLGKIEKTLLITFIFLILFPFPKGANHFFWKYFFDAGHPVLFFLCTFFIYRIYQPQNLKDQSNKILHVFIISLATASLLEGIQPIFGRSAGLKDLCFGYLGVITASLTLMATPLKKATGLLSFIIIQLAVFQPVIKAIETIIWRKNNFPLLADFESSKQLILWEGGFEKIYKDKNFYLKIYPNEDEDYWGRYFAGDKNWEQYKELTIDIYSPDNNFIAMRIDDNGDCTEFSDRFNKRIDLRTGWNKINIKIDEIKSYRYTREFNLKKVRFLYFFADKDSWIGIDNIKLK